MVLQMWVENNHRNTLSEQIMTNVSGEKRPMKSEESEHESLVNKRCKTSSSQAAHEVPLSLYGPGPLGLKMKKSQSFAELIEAILSQSNKNNVVLPTQVINNNNVVLPAQLMNNNNVVLPKENIRSGNKKYAKSKAGTSRHVKNFKASNFPALLLRIGKWEYVSQNEGDLVAKFYFAKCRMVWEVLEDGLKNKIEIQWSDIVGLKANYPDNGPGVLTIVLRKEPLFFRETDPQPRKHTQWQKTSDFTNGEASKYREHYLEFEPGVLNKHYEMLIQCDTRLNSLSQQPKIVFDLPFAANASINVVNKNDNNQLEMSGLDGSNITGQVNQPRIQQSVDHIGHFNNPGHVLHFPESSGLEWSNNFGQVNNPSVQQTTSIFDPVNTIDHMIDNMSQILLSDTQLTTSSDENNLMSRVNSLCALFNDGNDFCAPDPGMNYINNWDDGNDCVMLDSNMLPENADIGMSREDSFNNFVDQLPKIASFSDFLF